MSTEKEKEKTCGECKYFILDSSGFCKSNKGQEDSGNDCCSFFKPKVITNDEYIRQMSNIELANAFADACPPNMNKKCIGSLREDCFKCWLEWLESEVKE